MVGQFMTPFWGRTGPHRSLYKPLFSGWGMRFFSPQRIDCRACDGVRVKRVWTVTIWLCNSPPVPVVIGSSCVPIVNYIHAAIFLRPRVSYCVVDLTEVKRLAGMVIHHDSVWTKGRSAELWFAPILILNPLFVASL